MQDEGPGDSFDFFSRRHLITYTEEKGLIEIELV